MGRLNRRFIRRRTENYSAYENHLKSLDEDALLTACDIHPARIDEIVEYLSKPSRLLSFYCQGTNQSTSGVDKNVALINLHLQLGEVGIRGAGSLFVDRTTECDGRQRGRLSVAPIARLPRRHQRHAPRLSGRCVASATRKY